MQNQQTPNPTPPAAAPATPDPNENTPAVPNLSHSEKLQAITDMLGGAPEPIADADELQNQIIQKQFQQDVELKLIELEREAKSLYPDASDDLAYQIGLATASGNLQDLDKYIREAVRREAERDEKTEEQKALHVEGGASGNPAEAGIGTSVYEKMSKMYWG